MKEQRSAFTRRGFLASTVTFGAVVSQASVLEGRQPRSAFGIDALGLDPATRADLESFAQAVLRETAWLDELPLDNVSPAFRFVPPGGDE